MDHNLLPAGSIIKWHSQKDPKRSHVLRVLGKGSLKRNLECYELTNRDHVHSLTPFFRMDKPRWYLLANSELEWERMGRPLSYIQALEVIYKLSPGKLPLLM